MTPNQPEALLARFRAFVFPGGEESARSVKAVRNTQKGEMRLAPGASWLRFTAEEEIDARRSRFRWEAKYQGGKFGWISVTDAYEEGHGRLVVKLGGIVPVQQVVGPEADKGEIQRYFGSILLCPPILLNHGSLEWTATGPDTLRVRDCEDPTNATVDWILNQEGSPRECRADRPRIAGKHAPVTPWFGRATDFQEWEGMRLARGLEVSWELPEELFTYFRVEITALRAVR